MKTRGVIPGVVPFVAACLSGCAAPKVDFSQIERPARAAELDEYNVFVGSWDWHAEMLNAEEPDKTWTGTGQWEWTLDNRCLQGRLSAKSGRTNFDSMGIWSWHPKDKQYFWGLMNNWGYPQHGTAKYDKDSRSWTMPYTSVGLDGTASHGEYRMKVVDDNTLDWSMVEWADGLHMVKKMEMKGTYKRRM